MRIAPALPLEQFLSAGALGMPAFAKGYEAYQWALKDV